MKHLCIIFSITVLIQIMGCQKARGHCSREVSNPENNVKEIALNKDRAISDQADFCYL